MAGESDELRHAWTVGFRVETPDSGHMAESEPARPAFEKETSIPILPYRLTGNRPSR